MQNLKILNKKETKHILQVLEEQYGFQGELDYAFLLSTKNKIYIISKAFADINDQNLRIDTAGLYFGELKDDAIRLSIEGSQMIGRQCAKNIIEISKDDEKKWMFGMNIPYTQQLPKGKGYLLIRSGDDYLGSSSLKNNELLNYIPKTRYIGTLD